MWPAPMRGATGGSLQTAVRRRLRCALQGPTLSAASAFDVVILDPPAFIKRRKDIPQGQAAYRKLNQLALALLADAGLLVSCSCSYHLAPEELLNAIQAAARHGRRFVQILETGGQSADHIPFTRPYPKRGT